MALFRLPLPGGIFKVKHDSELRSRERKRLVPMVKIGKYYLIWWPNSMSEQDPRKKRPE